MENKQPHYHII